MVADLIEENPVQAESFTLKFSEIYRYVVTHLDDEMVPVHEEIHFVKNYCELQEISSPHTILPKNWKDARIRPYHWRYK